MGGNLVLIGFMGSGKTTVGKRVARLLGAPFVDLDDRIRELTGRTIPELFELNGEDGFRAFESAALAQALAAAGQVIAVGGGAPVVEANWRLIRDGNLVVRLNASMPETLRRLGSGEGRPLAGGGAEERSQRLEDLLARREARYAEAPHQVETSGRHPAAIAAEVVEIAHREGLGP
jgi:shikimate kinase